MKKLFFVLFCFAFAGCQVVKDADDVESIEGGRCLITENVSDKVICVDFTDGSDSNTDSAKCDELKTAYASAGANGVDFLSGNSNDCDQSGTVLNYCSTSFGTVYYYDDNFADSNAASSDCTGTLGGTWH